MSDLNANCPQCGAELPDGAPGGLCPRCLMAGAMEQTGDQARPEPPSIENVQAAFQQLLVEEIVGVGGMGVVYRAKQTALNRDVALKLLAPHREQQPGFAERFTREAQALAAMNHPNIVTVYDFGQTNGFFYLLMEYVDGVNLRQGMEAGKFTPEEALAIVPPICEALQYAHDRGIVHRDIKPENLLLDKDGIVKVADFGIARILSEAEPNSDGATDIDEDSLTAGTALGTPNYMAPEQAAAPESVDSRADIYSLGVVFYEMLTGERPVGSITPPSKRVKVDVRLDEIVMRALADQPELRWQSATDLRTEVETIVAKSPPPPPIPRAPSPAAPAKSTKSKTALLLGCGVWPCGVLALLGILAFSGILLALSAIRSDFGGRVAPVRLLPDEPQAIDIVKVPVSLSEMKLTTESAEAPAVFSFTRHAQPGNSAWDLWAVTRTWILGPDFEKIGISHSSAQKLNDSGHVTVRLNQIEWNDDVLAEARASIPHTSPWVLVIQAGEPYPILQFTDGAGESIETYLELRPSALSGGPRNLIYIREFDAHPDEGWLAVAWNGVEYVGDYDLMLETRGAAVQYRSQDLIEGVGFGPNSDRNAVRFSRRKIDGVVARCASIFRPSGNSTRRSLSSPFGASPIAIERGDMATLFDLTDATTHHRASAVLKLVPSGTLAEVLPADDEVPDQQLLPGSPLPPPPYGASFVAERHVAFGWQRRHLGQHPCFRARRCSHRPQRASRFQSADG